MMGPARDMQQLSQLGCAAERQREEDRQRGAYITHHSSNTRDGAKL
jgi:hypothetical protein